MPFAAKRLDMLDPGYGFKDFQLLSGQIEIGFLETRIGPNSSLIGKKVKDLNLTFDFIVAKIERNGKTIVPGTCYYKRK